MVESENCAVTGDRKGTAQMPKLPPGPKPEIGLKENLISLSDAGIDKNWRMPRVSSVE